MKPNDNSLPHSIHDSSVNSGHKQTFTPQLEPRPYDNHLKQYQNEMRQISIEKQNTNVELLDDHDIRGLRKHKEEQKKAQGKQEQYQTLDEDERSRSLRNGKVGHKSVPRQANEHKETSYRSFDDQRMTSNRHGKSFRSEFARSKVHHGSSSPGSSINQMYLQNNSKSQFLKQQTSVENLKPIEKPSEQRRGRQIEEPLLKCQKVSRADTSQQNTLWYKEKVYLLEQEIQDQKY